MNYEKNTVVHRYISTYSNYTDIDECSSNKDNCHDNAECTNTRGGFICKCNTGYSGDGVTCTGMYFTFRLGMFLHEEYEINYSQL